ncbi:MAG: magnesium transporter [Hyperthermus sp.]|nr:MAG: magnesium transporter [Hyperthermus sp.]
MTRIVVYVEAPDKPGLLSLTTSTLNELGGNVVTSIGYRLNGRAYMLVLVEDEFTPEEAVSALTREIKDARIEAAELGPEAAPIIAEFLKEKPGIITVLESYIDPPDILDAVLRLPKQTRTKIYPMLTPETLALMLVEADEETVKEISNSVKIEDIANAISTLDPDEAVDVLQAMPEHIRKVLFQQLPEDKRREIARLLYYPPETAGGIMTTSVPVLHTTSTVQEALQLIRQADFDIKDVVVVIDNEGRLYGMIPVDELLRAAPNMKLEKLARKPAATAKPTEDQEEVARLMLRYEIRRLPVVDTEDRFLGIVAIEDIAYVLSEEAAEDMAKLGGLVEKPRERYLHATLVDLVKSRLPWLLLIYLIESITASVIRSYSSVIERVAIAAAFIPLIMDTGGNVGSQASTTIVRALALGEISERSKPDVVYTILKEGMTAISIGAFMSFIGFLFALVLSEGDVKLAFSIALTLFLVILFSDLVGTSLPIIARRLGLDPATVSSPFVTTIVDVSVAVIYLKLVSTLVLGL